MELEQSNKIMTFYISTSNTLKCFSVRFLFPILMLWIF